MRALIRSCFRRPVTVTAFYLLIAVAAATAVLRVPVSLLPDLRYPTLVVWTAYPDVPPERVERAITEIIDEAVAGTPGLRSLTSRSMLGGSMVRLDFSWNTNLDMALLEVREQIDRLGGRLPDEAEPPVVLRLDPNDRPIMVLALSQADAGGNDRVSSSGQNAARASGLQTAPGGDLVGLKRVGREVIARRLEQLPDIARVVVTGGYDRRIEVILDPARLAAHNVDITRIDAALFSANIAQPGGSIRRGPFRYAVEVTGEFQTVDDVANAIVARSGNAPVRLREIADVREGVDIRRGLVRFDGAETLMLLVERRPDSNTVRAAEEVREALDELLTELTNVRVDVVVDESRFISQAIGGVTQAVFLGGILAIIVLFVFLRRREALLAVAVAVPLSLGMTLVAFDFLGVTFNLISLSGLALGVGMLVDNAIVVVENIARLREQGLSDRQAGLEGAGEVAGAITASTLTTIAVFLPLTFVEGLAGRLFLDQSLAVVTSLASSLVVGLTAVPLIAAKSPLKRSGAGSAGSVSDSKPMMSGLTGRYESALGWSLGNRGVVVLGTLTVLIVAGAIGAWLPREVVPRTNQGRFNVHISLPPDSDLPIVDVRAATIARRLQAEPGIDHILADLGERDEARLQIDPRPTYEGDLTVLLEPGSALAPAMNAARTLDLPGDVSLDIRPVRTQLEQLIASEESDLIIDLVTERRELAETAFDEVLADLQQEPSLANVRLADEFDVPAYRLTFDRENMARFSVASRTIAAYIEASARGREATELRSINEDVPILLRTTGIDSIEDLLGQLIQTRAGPMPLSTFVNARFTLLPASLYRSDQTPVLRLLADVAPGSDLAEATNTIQATFDDRLPDTVRGRVSGANEAFTSSLNAVLWSLLFSVVLVYLILAAQFESLIQPILILVTVPLAAAGVALVLAVTGQTINLMSLTGSIVLVGIVVNDAIVKVDFINQRRAAGAARIEAILDAGRDRLRPILMTTITTVFGLLPLALGFGEGAELRAPMAIAIVGGLTLATVLTLFVVPVFYSLMTRHEDA